MSIRGTPVPANCLKVMVLPPGRSIRFSALNFSRSVTDTGPAVAPKTVADEPDMMPRDRAHQIMW